MEACSTAKSPRILPELLVLFHLYLIFNQKYLRAWVGVNINVTIQWKMVAKPDVLKCCALLRISEEV